VEEEKSGLRLNINDGRSEEEEERRSVITFSNK